MDVKLYANILALRFQEILPRIKHKDHVGFIHTREGRDNVLKTCTLIEQMLTKSEEAIFLSTDAEKAFNRVSWPFPEATLKQIGMGNIALG